MKLTDGELDEFIKLWERKLSSGSFPHLGYVIDRERVREVLELCPDDGTPCPEDVASCVTVFDKN